MKHNFNWVYSPSSGNLINHWSMNWTLCKDAVADMCLTGVVVEFWSLIQEVAGLNPFTVMTNILLPNSQNSVEICTFPLRKRRMRNGTATNHFHQIIPEFLPTDTVQEEIDPTVGNVQCTRYLKDYHWLGIIKRSISSCKY